ncbi:Aklanonic acid methyltransferase DauC [bacterium HR10]|nr:Aklanonic acid methyltransferase DauC [bacterium HR10]
MSEPSRNWETTVEGWIRWATVLEQGMRVISDRLIALCCIPPAGRVLDIATGIGEPALAVAQYMGGGGRIIAIDRSPQMLRAAHRRMGALGLSNVTFLQMDAERLGFLPLTFHAVFCRFGLMFLHDVRGALEMIRSLLVPGGRFAAAVWGPPEHVPLLAVALGPVHEALRMPAPTLGEPGPFRLADAPLLLQALREAGFALPRVEHLQVEIIFSSVAEYVEAIRALLPERQHVERLPAERQTLLWEEIAQRARAYQDERGFVRFSNEVICVVGVRDPGDA